MVEGPGCKLKGEKIKGKLQGQTVKKLSGNAVDRERKPTKGVSTSTFHQLEGRNLDGVQTLGKELFMYFGEICLRVHFLMAGSFRVNDMKLDNDFTGDTETATLELVMSKDTLKFYKSAVDIRTTQSCKERYDSLNEVDICSPKFNQRRAITMVMEQAGRQLCDVLLDQVILPGVGNIIKNEALFDSGINPGSKVEDLREEHVSHLVKMTRDFSMIFYKCRKEGTNLSKFMKIYKKKTCGQCEGKVTICRLGDDNERLTFFCPSCQDNSLKNKTKMNLPSKNSLLGWVQSAQHTTEVPDWSCSACTFINKSSKVNCDICSTPKPGSSAIKDNVLQENMASLQTSVVRTVPPTSVIVSQPMKRKLDTNLHSANHPFKRVKQETTIGKTKIDSGGDDTSKIPQCPGHNRKCALVEVHKKGDNYGRWFFTCSIRPKNKQCKYFQWADERFPICEGHGKPCTLRTVMKQGPNNGRKFFACKMPKNKQCGFFQWAVGYDC